MPYLLIFNQIAPKGDLLPQFHHRESLFHSRGRMKKNFFKLYHFGGLKRLYSRKA